MDEKTIFCLLFSFLGTTILLFIASSSIPTMISPSQLSNVSPGELVLVSGRLSKVSEYNGHVFLLVCDSSCVEVPVFSSLAKQMQKTSFDPYSAKAGAYLSVEGTLRERGNRLSIVPLGPNSIDYK